MATYYTNDDGFIYKKEDDKVSILSWRELEFNDAYDLYDKEEIEDPKLNKLFGIDELFDLSNCRIISKQEVKKKIENHMIETAINGTKLIESL